MLTYQEAVRAGAQALADRYGEDEVFIDRQNSAAVLTAVGYADLLAEVERLRIESERFYENRNLWQRRAEDAEAERDALAATVARVEALAKDRRRHGVVTGWHSQVHTVVRWDDLWAALHPEKGTD